MAELQQAPRQGRCNHSPFRLPRHPFFCPCTSNIAASRGDWGIMWDLSYPSTRGTCLAVQRHLCLIQSTACNIRIQSMSGFLLKSTEAPRIYVLTAVLPRALSYQGKPPTPGLSTKFPSPCHRSSRTFNSIQSRAPSTPFHNDTPPLPCPEVRSLVHLPGMLAISNRWCLARSNVPVRMYAIICVSREPRAVTVRVITRSAEQVNGLQQVVPSSRTHRIGVVCF